VDKLCYKRISEGLKIRNRVYVRRGVRKEEIDSAYSNEYGESIMALRLTQHIRFGLTPLSLGTLLPSVATSYMLGPLSEIPTFFKLNFLYFCNVDKSRGISYTLSA